MPTRVLHIRAKARKAHRNNHARRMRRKVCGAMYYIKLLQTVSCHQENPLQSPFHIEGTDHPLCWMEEL
jgi:hypothetical protein